jgi:hypothetical protein
MLGVTSSCIFAKLHELIYICALHQWLIFMAHYVEQCLSTFCVSRHPYWVIKVFGGPLSVKIGLNTIGITGCTEAHLCVEAPRLGTTYVEYKSWA